MPDKRFADASVEAIGRAWASLFHEMVLNGMSRREALEVLKVYVAGLAMAPPRPPEPPDPKP